MLRTLDLSPAERISARRNRRAADAAAVVAASAIRSATADPTTADVAADILAAEYVRAAAVAERPDVAAALAAVVRERDGRTANGRRAAERATAAERESQGYLVPRESHSETITRLVRQRYGDRAATVTANALAADHDAMTAHMADVMADTPEDKRPTRLALRTLYVADRLAAARVKSHRQVSAFIAALLAEAPTMKRDHDAATCTNPKCYRCTAARNEQGKRANTAPVRDIGTVGPLTVERQGKRQGYRPTAAAPRERTTPRAVHLLRETSLLTALDQSREHHAQLVQGMAEQGRPTSPLVTAALLALTSADGRSERVHLAERAAALPGVAAEQGKRAAVERAAAESLREQGRYASWWAVKSTTAADRAAARVESVQCHRTAAEHARRAYRAAAASALASAEQDFDPRTLTAAATAVALHAVRPGTSRVKGYVTAGPPALASALAAVERAERPPQSKRAAAYRAWSAHRLALTAAARSAVTVHQERPTTATTAAARSAVLALAEHHRRTA
jgi:hypothetical protein